MYKDPCQDLGRSNNYSYMRYLRKCFTQIYRTLYGDAMLELIRMSSNMADGNQKHLLPSFATKPHRFKKRGNEDQYRFNLKLSDAIEEAKDACSARQFDKVHASLEKGEKLLTERQKHILLADKSDFGWSLIREYKRNDLAEDSDDEKEIIRAEARAPRLNKADV